MSDTYAGQVVEDGAIAYWRLNEASGTVAADSVGTAHGTISATGVTLGQAGALADGSKAMLFDGVAGVITVALGSWPPFGTNPLTVECWFKTSAPQESWMVDTKQGAGATSSGISIGLNGTAVYFELGVAGVGVLAGSGTFTYHDNTWHHAVMTLSRGAVDTFSWYVDGLVAGSSNAPITGLNPSATVPLSIGTFTNNSGSTHRYQGVFDEVALYHVALTPAQIANHYALRTAVPIEPEPEPGVLTLMPHLTVQLAPGVWTDLTQDVIASAGIRTTRGMSGSGPLDRVATPGILTFTLRNDAGNSGHTLGWYSPDHVHVRPGWTPGIPVKLELTYADDPYPVWTGRVRTIAPEPGRYLSRYVEVTCHDVIGDLTETVIRAIPPQINQTEDALLEAVVAALPATLQPPLALDAGLDELPFVFDDLGEGAPALQLVTDVMTSVYGTLFAAADGTLVYRNRQSANVADPLATFADPDLLNDGGLELQAGLASVYNRVRATVHPRTLGPTTNAILFQVEGLITIPGGETVTIWGTYADQGNTLQLVGGMDFQLPLVANTDYKANSQSNGGGTDLTASMTITVNAYASGAEFIITNGHTAGPAYLVDAAGTPLLQLRGRAIYDQAPVTVESYTAQPYGDRLLTTDLKYQDDAEVAQSLVDFIQPLYNTASRRVVRLGFNPQQSEPHLLAALEREIGDVVTVTETVTGLETVPVAIRGVEWEIQPGRPAFARVGWTVAPALIGGSPWILDDAVQSILDETTVLGWG